MPEAQPEEGGNGGRIEFNPLAFRAEAEAMSHEQRVEKLNALDHQVEDLEKQTGCCADVPDAGIWTWVGGSEDGRRIEAPLRLRWQSPAPDPTARPALHHHLNPSLSLPVLLF